MLHPEYSRTELDKTSVFIVMQEPATKIVVDELSVVNSNERVQWRVTQFYVPNHVSQRAKKRSGKLGRADEKKTQSMGAERKQKTTSSGILIQ
jgi:hypothetical protein